MVVHVYKANGIVPPILVLAAAWAEKRSYHTSKAARLDTYRAGK